MSFRSLGKSRAEFAGLDTFEAPTLHHVSLISDEVTAVCPVTGQPDWYTVSIGYKPDKLCLESKSLKLYLHGYRNEGIMAEPLAAKILGHVVTALEPIYARVDVTQKPRGGISIKASAEWYKPLPERRRAN
jgi:7-cyano-7-deazaguanine reductase